MNPTTIVAFLLAFVIATNATNTNYNYVSFSQIIQLGFAFILLVSLAYRAIMTLAKTCKILRDSFIF